MANQFLNQAEWAEVSRAIEESTRKPPAKAPRPGSMAALLSLVGRIILGNMPEEEPDTPRRQALRRFVQASTSTRHIAEEHVPALLSLGLNRRQVEALAMLTITGHPRIEHHGMPRG